MASWKKVIVSGSDAHLNHITASGNISGSSTTTGSFGLLQVDGGNFTSSSLALAVGSGRTDATISGSFTSTSASIASDIAEFKDGTVPLVSGSSVSTGSFGEVRVGGMTVSSLTTFSSSVATKFNSLDADIIALSIALG